ncbi:MAG: NAD(P)/FAD-dependent oxidoreductase, partial [Geminicoccaceae bacterium]
AETLGAKICQASVNDVDLRDGRVAAIITDQDRHECDVAILAAGAWSKRLAEKLGLSVPLESERGYHIQFKNTNVVPKAPLMVTTGKFVATPMTQGLRCAGVVEFGGLKAPASTAPLALLRKKAKETFPSLEAGEETTWLGHRPALPDSLPVIGEIRNTGVFTGFGHHHIGLTAGPKTGRILAGLITGKRQNIDLEPYRPGRFAARGGAH